MALEGYRSLSYREASDFFAGKVRLPSKRYDDIKRGEHAKAFIVAGAEKDALLVDFQTAMQEIIDGKATLGGFRKRFEEIVKRNGWTGWTGEDSEAGRAWRARTIAETNFNTAYQAGRFKQQTDPDVLRYRPWWVYRHSDFVMHPRKLHVAWDGMVFAADDPVWKWLYPPNDWGCHCYVDAISDRELKAMGKTGPDTPPSAKPNAKTGAPDGIGKGWDYNVGEAAWGRNWAAETIKRGDPVEIDPKQPADYPELPAQWPARRPAATVHRGALDTVDQVRALLPTGFHTDPAGQIVNVTDALIDHWMEGKDKPDDAVARRARYLPLLPGVIKEPDEIWFGFVRYDDGKVEVRRRYSASYDVGGGQVVGFVADFIKGQWSGLTVVPERRAAGGNLRRGRLLWSRSGDGLLQRVARLFGGGK